jgi:hypothetical protein
MNSISFNQLHRIAGYIEAGEGESVTYMQDDATKCWSVKVGNLTYHASSLNEAFEAALSAADKYYAQEYDMPYSK